MKPSICLPRRAGASRLAVVALSRVSGRAGLVLALSTISFGCRPTAPRALPPAQSALIADSIRAFVAGVAAEVTARGPVAWRPVFADTSSFYMAANGQLVIPSSDSATRLIARLEHLLPHLELHWGSDVRVDVLGPGLASVGMPYREVQRDSAGRQAVDAGYFTGVVAHRPAGWQFLSANWSPASVVGAAR